MYVNSFFDYTLISTFNKEYIFEHVWITINVRYHKITVGVVYEAPGHHPMKFAGEFEDLLDAIYCNATT